MTFTRLTLGEPRLRGKVKGGTVALCEEPLEYGANVLKDSGFESHPVGPIAYDHNWDTNSTNTSTGLLEVDTNEADPTQWGEASAGLGWMTPYVFVGVDHVNHWTVSTASPRSGSQHARYTRPSGYNTPDLAPYRQASCDPLVLDRVTTYSARVEPGDFLEFSYYVKVDNTTGVPASSVTWYFHGSDYASTGIIFSDTTNLTTSYQQIGDSIIAPADSHYVIVVAEPSFQPAVGATLDVDDAVLEIQP